MKSDSSKQPNHVLQELHFLGMSHRQPASQGRGEGWNEFQVVCLSFMKVGPVITEPECEVVQVLELSDEV